MELRSRSRSKTPLLITSYDKEMYDQEDHVETVVRTKRSSTIKTMENHKNKTNSRSSKTKAMQKKYFTSDYSSEEGDNDSSPSKTSSQNIRNQLIEDRSNHNEMNVSALKIYKEAGEYWNKYPKTDYTYSRHSKDRFELAPGVVAMPNMSRKSLHWYDGTELFTANKQTNTETDGSTHNVLTRRALFSNNNYDESREYSISTRNTQNMSIYRRITRSFLTVYTLVMSMVHYVFTIQRSWFIQVAKWIHMMTSVVMLLDTRLLKRSSKNRNNRKISSLLLLLLIPLLLLAGWWLTTGTTKYIYEAYKTAIDSIPMVTIGGDDKGKDVDSDSSKFVLENIVKEVKSEEHHNIRIDTDELMQKILNSPKIQEIIRSNNAVNKKVDTVASYLENDISNNLFKQQSIVDSLKDENHKIRLAMAEHASATKQHLNVLLNQMQLKMNTCCTRSLINIEGYVLQVLKNLFSMPDHVVSQKDAQSWLQSLFIAKNDLEARIDNLTSQLNQNFNKLVSSNTKKIMDDVTNVINKELNRRFETVRNKEVIIDTLGEDRIKEIVSNSLAIYDADKTGLVDYAMEPSGGQIVSTRCTETYNAGTAVISILGIGLWNPVNTPRTVITPGMKPGECWAFQNFPGYLIIKLVQPIRIEMFSYEHISKLLVPNGKITSAPKEFSVYGLQHEEDKDSVEIGRYTYDANGPPLQYFPVQNNTMVYQIIELVVHNNNGNPNYTCLYRFRVHGTPVAEPT